MVVCTCILQMMYGIFVMSVLGSCGGMYHADDERHFCKVSLRRCGGMYPA